MTRAEWVPWSPFPQGKAGGFGTLLMGYHTEEAPLSGTYFAGTELRIPVAGDRVRVISGEDFGQEFTVVRIAGNVYRPDQQVFVDHPREIPTWYYPWDLEVVG